MKRSYRIDGARITDFSSFVAEVDRQFISQIEGSHGWRGNLDALNDYMSWPDEPFEIVVANPARCAEALGYPETAKRLQRLLKTCHPANVAHLQAELARAERREGRTLWDIVLGIFRGNEMVQVRFEPSD